MQDESESRFPPIEQAFNKRERLDCFAKFFGESVHDAQGLPLEQQSANRCQDCPDSDICFKLWILNSLQDIRKTQNRLAEKLDLISGRNGY